MQTIYILSGLGVNHRVFDQIDFGEFVPVHIQWITPLKNEPIDHYALRISAQITTEKPILIALSFGGIIAQEIARVLPVDKIILIASVKTYHEIPNYFRIAGKIGLHKIIPMYFLRHANLITHWFFGTRNTTDKQLLKQILLETDPVFIRWALHQTVNWNNKIPVQNVIHIHGTSDRILPIRHVKCNIPISDGGHFMTVNRSDEIADAIQKIITT
ncbi:MAG: alpha/beta hydrolase [Bacteroidetes bacterium]|nr:alpha/beta hydrolase [Bacteroidota bacterium]